MNNKAIGIIFDRTIPGLGNTADVSIGGKYKLIDFALSNMSNSGICNVGIITSDNINSLSGYVGSSKAWDLARKEGGVEILHIKGEFNRWHMLKSAMRFLRDSDERYVVVTSGNCVSNIDYGKVLDFHEQRFADITIICNQLNSIDCQKLYLEADGDGKLTRASLQGGEEQNIYAHAFVINKELLFSLLFDSEDEIESFEKDVICKNGYGIYVYEHSGYYANIDADNYYNRSMELLDRNKCASLLNNDGAFIYTNVSDGVPAKFMQSASVKNSIIADGCVIKGRVENSILHRGVKIAEDTVVKDSILWEGVEIGEGSSLNCVIAAENARILESRTLSGHQSYPYIIKKNATI